MSLYRLAVGSVSLLHFPHRFVRSADEIGGQLGLARFRPIVDYGAKTIPDGGVHFALPDLAVAPHELGVRRTGAALVKGDEFLVLSGGGGELSLRVKRLGRLELEPLDFAQFGKSLNFDLFKPRQLGRGRFDGRPKPNRNGANQSELFFAVNHRLYSECA